MPSPRHYRFLACLAALTLALCAANADAASIMTIKKADGGRYDVFYADKLFTSLHTQGFPKPILYPIHGPNGEVMVRHYPMKKGVEGERSDHPHHQSLWFTHGSVNGVSFWHIGSNAGKIVTTEVVEARESGSECWITIKNKWVDAKGNVLCTDTQKITFHKGAVANGAEYSMIDYDVTIHASEGDVTFGDTKEGTMGIRSHPGLRANNGAHAVNSEGVTGKAVWGKRAKWVDYSGKIDGNTVGFAIFDHPSNKRHPTHWHARDYGLVAANPFGIHNFERKPKGTGDMVIKKGQSQSFRYRFVFHQGDAKQVGVAKLFEDYAKGK